jgi:hypothetical protein
VDGMILSDRGSIAFGDCVVTAHILCRLRCASLHGAGLILFAVFLAAALAGCATSVNSLSQAEMQTINIQSVDIKFKPDAHIWWGNAEREYAAKVAPTSTAAKPDRSATAIKTVPGDKDSDDYRELMDTPEAKAYLRDKLAAMVKDRLSYFVTKYQGTRPVRLEVEIHSFVIPSPLQRIALGGTPMLAAVTVLRDSATGKELGKLDRVAAGYAGNGIVGVAVDQAGDDLEDRVLDKYMGNVRAWLAGT